MFIAQQTLNISTILHALVPHASDGLGTVLAVFLYFVLLADFIMLVIPKPPSNLFSIMAVLGILSMLLTELSINVGGNLVGGSSIQELLTPKTLANFILQILMVVFQIIAAGSATKPPARNWAIFASIVGTIVVLGQFARGS